MDRISSLPDEILSHILSFLPTKRAVATSILSSRWSNLWTFLPIIDLQTKRCKPKHQLTFRNFVSRLVSLNSSPILRKFRLKHIFFDYNHFSLINQWVNALIPKNLVELDLDIVLDCDFSDIDEFCLKLLPCESLQILKLSLLFDLEMPMSSGSFNNLRVFHLSYSETDLYRELVENIFPSLPRLEELSIKATIWELDEEKRCFNITAPVLKSLVMSIEFLEKDYTEVEIVIDAPCLEYFCLKDERMSSYPVLNVPSLSEAKITVWNSLLADICLFDDVHTVTNYINALRLLRGVSNAKHLSLSTGQSLGSCFAHQDNLAKFPLLTKFELFVPHNCGWNLLLNVLACAPNLEVLIIFKKGFGHADLPGEFLTPESIPTCLLLHLKEVKIKGLKKRECAKFVVYLIENAKLLKDLTVKSASFVKDGQLIQELFAELKFLYT